MSLPCRDLVGVNPDFKRSLSEKSWIERISEQRNMKLHRSRDLKNKKKKKKRKGIDNDRLLDDFTLLRVLLEFSFKGQRRGGSFLIVLPPA